MGIKKYTESDEWVELEGNVATVGITDHAQKQLGDIVFIEVHEAGSTVTRGEAFGNIESVKAVSDLIAPMSGTITESNAEVIGNPERINEGAETTAWIIRIQVSDPAEFDSLLDRDAYLANTES